MFINFLFSLSALFFTIPPIYEMIMGTSYDCRHDQINESLLYLFSTFA